MSGAPVQPRSRELEIVRVLFDKHLLDRAVNLAEARWVGSGDMVRLAYHWPELPPTERRARLEQIGPERLAKFRALAELDPDLSRVLETLDERGVLASTPVSVEAPLPEDGSQPAVENAASVPTPEPPHPAAEPVDVEYSELAITDEARAAIAAEVPHLVAAGASIDDVIVSERERHADALASGEEMLQRVREKLDSSARQVTSRALGDRQALRLLPATVRRVETPRHDSAALVVDASAHPFAAPGPWLDRLNEERVVVADGQMPPPTDDQLVAIANELGLGIAEFVAGPGETRSLFGGLKRAGRDVTVETGPLPGALAEPCLGVIHGRLMPKVVQRLRSGMCDIPGTKMSVRIHPDTRVLIIP